MFEREGVTDFLVLAYLAEYGGGNKLRRRCCSKMRKEFENGGLQIARGSVFRALGRLRSRGLLTMQTIPEAENYSERVTQYCTLTPSGESELERTAEALLKNVEQLKQAGQRALAGLRSNKERGENAG